MEATKCPALEWTQRDDLIFIKIKLEGATDIKCESGKNLNFSCKADGQYYAINEELHRPVKSDPKVEEKSDSLIITLEMAEKEFWLDLFVGKYAGIEITMSNIQREESKFEEPSVADVEGMKSGIA